MRVERTPLNLESVQIAKTIDLLCVDASRRPEDRVLAEKLLAALGSLLAVVNRPGFPGEPVS